jgi:RNA polymerase sigma-70 factor (ECF subfamily)
MRSASQAVEEAARQSYGRLIAILAAGSRDIAAAEEALSGAFLAALSVWPQRGVPGNPDAWLITTARNAMHNLRRHSTVRAAAALEVERRYHELSAGRDAFPDERLKLLFVCAHPAIDEAIRTPLMLQTILGIDAVRIANAFLVSPATMGQRLVRAKTKIRDAGIRFEMPEREELPDRLADVLNAIYAVFGTGWDENPGEQPGMGDLAHEAIYLCRVIVSLLPDQPEAYGLLALMLFCEARRSARRDPHGRFVQLDRQDTRLWSRDMIVEAEGHLTAASRFRIFGRFQCEAAIQSVHAQRAITGMTNYAALRTLYDLLLARAPSVGVMVSRAAMLMSAGDLAAAADGLASVPQDKIANYQPYWVARARLLKETGNFDEATSALATAIALTRDAATTAFLTEQLTLHRR